MLRSLLLSVVVLAPCIVGCASGSSSSRAGSGADPNPGDRSVQLVNKVLIYVRDAYVDRSSIEPRKMLEAGLLSVQREFPAARVDLLASYPVRITVGAESQTFPVEEIDSLRKLAFSFRGMEEWLAPRLQLAPDSDALGFAAANGMLSTLGPHCYLKRKPKKDPDARVDVVEPTPRLVRGEALAPRIAYVGFTGLPARASRELIQVVAGLSEDFSSLGGLAGLVIDLRGNTGGLLEQALQVANAFLVQGAVIVKVVQSKPTKNEVRKASGPLAYPVVPIVVLVDGATASGAEVVASALKDDDRALVVGERTAGAGTVDVFYDLQKEDLLLKLTIARMFRPSGPSIDGLGVVPDVELRAEGIAAAPGSTSAKPRPETLERPMEKLSYLPRPDTNVQPLDPLLAEDEVIVFARDVLQRSRNYHRQDLLAAAQAVAQERRHGPASRSAPSAAPLR